VKDSSHLVEIISGIKVEKSDLLASFDILSLFTNVPINEAIQLFKNKYNLDEPHVKLAKLCLGSTYFTFYNCLYEQTEGAAMGSPLSPITADIFMEEFKEKLVYSNPMKPSPWLRYVDDCLITWKHGREKLNSFLEYLNNCHKNTKFTIELEKDGRIPFLDVLLMRKPDGTIGHTVYRKPTHTDRYLDAHFHHHIQLNSQGS
jgi:hypothetical protein